MVSEEIIQGTNMSFDDWFYEVENYGLRAERFYEDLQRAMDDPTRMVEWLKAAYEQGKNHGNLQH
jgi:hypothetical protein